jgi:hypothetical protein
MRVVKAIVMFLVVATGSLQASASQISCEGWFQEPGHELERVKMAASQASENNTRYSLDYRGYAFRVDWDRQLTTFYVSIESAGKRILVTTARVPTDNHPENFTDLNLPNGPRLAVNCEMK